MPSQDQTLLRLPEDRARESYVSAVRAGLASPLPGRGSSALSAGKSALPCLARLAGIVDVLTGWLFPGYFDEEIEEEELREALEEQIARGFRVANSRRDTGGRATSRENAAARVHDFLLILPDIQSRLWVDVEAAFAGDPAAESRDEIVLSYPGLRAITHYRLAHELNRLEVPLLPRMITERAHGATGIDIHPAAVIGDGLFLDHGTGIVIGETCQIGHRVRIYQGVTLGAKTLPFDEAGKAIRGIPRHPIVADEVVIYAGATILGRVQIGQGSVIGGNVWLTQSVPPRSRITQASVRQSRFEEGAGI